MTDTATIEPPEAPDDVTVSGTKWLVPIALGVIALCAGVWIGFKIAGGTVASLAADDECEDCDDDDERRILGAETLGE